MKSTSLQKTETKQKQHCLELSVVFTTVQNTLLSLQTTTQLAGNLEAHIQLLVPDSDLYPASLITPRTLAEFAARYFLTMLPHDSDLRIKIVSYPANTGDLWEVLPPQSLIVMAGNKHRFWPSTAQRFARQLQKVGHEVIFLPVSN